MDVRRTAVVKLTVFAEQRDALHRTAEQYLYCANRTADYCWSDTSYTECKTNKREVRDALYPNFERRQTYRPSLSKPLSNALSKPSKRVSNGGKGTARLLSHVHRRNDGLRHPERDLLPEQGVAGNC